MTMGNDGLLVLPRLREEAHDASARATDEGRGEARNGVVMHLGVGHAFDEVDGDHNLAFKGSNLGHLRSSDLYLLAALGQYSQSRNNLYSGNTQLCICHLHIPKYPQATVFPLAWVFQAQSLQTIARSLSRFSFRRRHFGQCRPVGYIWGFPYLAFISGVVPIPI